jgi:hypothetical protein
MNNSGRRDKQVAPARDILMLTKAAVTTRTETTKGITIQELVCLFQLLTTGRSDRRAGKALSKGRKLDRQSTTKLITMTEAPHAIRS